MIVDQIKQKEKLISYLKEAQKKGYKYIVASQDSEWHHLFSHTPRKYSKYGDPPFWGYTDKDLNNSSTLPADLVRSKAHLSFISSDERSPRLLEEVIELLEGAGE